MFHLSGYTVLVGTVADLDAPVIADDIYQTQNSHFILSRQKQLIAAMGLSATLNRIKLASPSMRQIAAPFMRPTIQATVGTSNPNICLLDHAPFTLQPFEEIQMLVTSDIGAMTERFTGLIWTTDGIEPLPPGNITAIRWTSTTAAVANAWQTLTITLADQLPAGRYAIVGSEHFSTNAIAHRLIISNQTDRPGFSSFVNTFSRHPYAIAKGQFGVLGRFLSNDLPRVQVLCNAADATHVGYIHVVRVGNI